MQTRRDFVIGAAGAAAAIGTPGCSAMSGHDRYDAMAAALRRPLALDASGPALFREMIRCATLAANGHNTQAWRFTLSENSISLHPDFSRRTAAVDPDDHHLWISMGCATENLAIAAAALGQNADVSFLDTRIDVAFQRIAPIRTALVAAIFRRQSTRSDYDGKSLPAALLRELETEDSNVGARIMLVTDRQRIETVLDYVTQGNTAQMRDAAFIRELVHWIRFNDIDAMRTGDGLFTRCTGNATVPGWLGRRSFPAFFRERSENDKYARQLRSSSGVAVIVGAAATPRSWFEVGRIFQRFALTATALGLQTALINQPVEATAVRREFGHWLGIGSARPDLVVRFGHSALLPYSLRRPIDAVLA